MPVELHEALRHRAAAARVSLSDYVLDLLEQAAAGPSTQQWLDSLADREPVPGVDVNAALDRARHHARVGVSGTGVGGLRR